MLEERMEPTTSQSGLSFYLELGDGSRARKGIEMIGIG